MSRSRPALATLLALSTVPIGAQAQVAPTPTPGAPTAAGTVVTNTAIVDIGSGPTAVAVNSNQTRQIVAERLDVALRTPSATLGVPVGPGAVPFTLTNTGNGSEAFVLTAQVAGVAATIQGFALDRNNDGVFDPAVDLAIAQNAATPVLAPGASAQLLVLLQDTTLGSSGTLTVRATAATGSGTPGTSFPGLGDGGGDALVGPTGAAASLPFTLTVVDRPATGAITLVKSQQVSGANGTTAAVPGATITYSIVATFGGTGTSPAARLLDPIPTGTIYVPGSLSLDGTVLSDAADTDAGAFGAGGVAVALGDVAAPVVHTVQFKVTIQ